MKYLSIYAWKLFLLLFLVLSSLTSRADWEIHKKNNPLGPGQAIDVLSSGKLIVRLVYGEGQIKPFLHVFGTDGELVTNPGLDKSGKGAGLFNHHRGIFIGWNRVSSDLGKYDMWHKGGSGNARYDIVKFETDITSDFEFYLQRVDKIFLDKEGKSQLSDRYDNKGLRYGDVKSELFQKIMDYFYPYRERRASIVNKPKEVREILSYGAKKANLVADKVLDRVRSSIGINYLK